MAMKVLAVGCHPDDLEILCAGTLALCRRRGDSVFMASAMTGSTGHRTIPPEKLAKVREAEMRASARIIGARVLWPGLDGAYLEDRWETRRALIDLIREAGADLVLTHSTDCYHPNHRAVARMMEDAVFTSSIPHVRTRFPAVRKPPALVLMDTVAGVDFQPTEYVDVTKVMAVKRRMLRKHRSQFVWLKSHIDTGPLEMMEAQARFRGLQCGVLYAEGFRPVLKHPLARPFRLLPA